MLVTIFLKLDVVRCPHPELPDAAGSPFLASLFPGGRRMPVSRLFPDGFALLCQRAIAKVIFFLGPSKLQEIVRLRCKQYIHWEFCLLKFMDEILLRINFYSTESTQSQLYRSTNSCDDRAWLPLSP